MNQKGEPIPWMNYPIINFLEERLNSDMTLFEYGSGYSTLFYASRVKSVVSVEYDMDWFNIMQSQLPSNVNLLYQTKDIDGEYCRKINFDGDRYDVVIVDGRDRVNCVKQSIQALTERGVILIDDSQRERYTEAIVFATEHGFKALSMEGLKPTGSKKDRTTILYKEGNCFGI
jgi:tRNA A58 N-methylase Trm61